MGSLVMTLRIDGIDEAKAKTIKSVLVNWISQQTTYKIGIVGINYNETVI